MPPKRTGPTTFSTAKHPRTQGPLHRIRPSQVIPIDPALDTIETPDSDPALLAITQLRSEGHAIGRGNHRKQYTKEFKLAALSYWREQSKPYPGPGLTKYKIAQKLQITDKMLKDWIANESSIVAMSRKQKRSTVGRQAQLPEMEEYLYTEFLKVRAAGTKISRSWFLAEGKVWYEAHYPDRVITDGTGGKTFTGFQFSRPWFARFKRRKGISLRRITNRSQQVPADSIGPIRSFHKFIRRHSDPKTRPPPPNPPEIDVPMVGRFRLGNIANMDQVPLEFEFLSGSTYDTVGSKTVWGRSQGSGLDKRQATVQLTIHADGVPRTKPLIVFRGKGTRITAAEKSTWDKRVRVHFQPNAWVDESVMIEWLNHQWKLSIYVLSTTGHMESILNNQVPRMLVLDVHRAQKTDRVKSLFKSLNTTMAMVPSGCTSLVQPLDVCINKPFKDRVKMAAEQHYTANLTKWTKGMYIQYIKQTDTDMALYLDRFTASERRILITQWVGEAWEAICIEHKELIIRSFQKCGITTALDGSEDSHINIRGLQNYVVDVEEEEVGYESQEESDSEYDIESEGEEEDAAEEGDYVCDDDQEANSEPTMSSYTGIRLGEEIF